MPVLITQANVNDQLAFYIASEAQALAQRDALSIENYMDREIFNPEMQDFLQSQQAVALLGNSQDNAALTLNFAQEKALKSFQLPEWLRFRFRAIKKKVKEAFCDVVTSISDDDLKTVIKAVLIALIPAFGGGVPGIATGLVIGFVALLIKGGIQAACPV